MIGHSMGGLVLRAALKHLKNYSSEFYCYMSLGTAHLGYFDGTNKLFLTGLKFLTSVSSEKCLK